MTAGQQPQVSEAQIAVHWREEEYYSPPAKFIAQANAADPGIFERFSEDRFPDCFKEYADLLSWEKVEIYNVTNGARLETFIVPGKPGSGEVRVNGAAAHLVRTGDIITIACYGALHVGQVLNHNPKFVYVDDQNRVTALKEG